MTRSNSRQRWLALGAIGVAAAVVVFLLREQIGAALAPPKLARPTETASTRSSTAAAATATITGREIDPSASPERSAESTAPVLRRPDERRTLSGLVRDLAGGPVAGATVELAIPRHPELGGTTTSDASGHYLLECWPSQLELVELLYDFWPVVRVTAASFVPLEVEVSREIEIDEPVDPALDLWVTRGARLVGRITRQEDDAPILDALVELRTGAGYPIRHRVLQSASSGAEGRYVFDAIPCRSVHAGTLTRDSSSRAVIGSLLVRAEGFALCSALVDAVDEGETLELDVSLVRAGRVRGRVVDGAGRPHAGVHVGMVGIVAGRFGELGETLVPNAITREDGGYLLEAVPLAGSPDGYQLQAWIEGVRGSANERTEERVVVRPGETIEVQDLVVRRLPSIAVRVIDGEGRPIAGAEVRPDSSASAIATDAEGRALVRSYREVGLERLEVDATGFLPTRTEPIEARVDPPEIVVRLARAHSIRGRVLHADGTPADGFAVRGMPGSVDEADAKDLLHRIRKDLGFSWSRFPDDVITARGGHFVVGELPDAPCHLFVTPLAGDPDEAPILAFVPRVPVDGERVEITLPPEAKVAPPPTGSVTVRVRDGGKPALALESLCIESSDGWVQTGRIVEPGSALFRDIPLGPWTLVGSVPDHAPFEVDFELTESEPDRTIEVDLAPDAEIRGTIRELAELATQGARLQAIGVDGWGITGSVESDGSFVIRDLQPGAPYRLELFTTGVAEGSRFWSCADPASFVAAEGRLDVGVVRFVPAGLVRIEVMSESFEADSRLEIVPAAGGPTVVLVPKSFPLCLMLPVGDIEVTLSGDEETFSGSTSIDAHDYSVAQLTKEE